MKNKFKITKNIAACAGLWKDEIKIDKKCVVISFLKQQYLKALSVPRTTTEIADIFDVCQKSALNRLKEL